MGSSNSVSASTISTIDTRGGSPDVFVMGARALARAASKWHWLGPRSSAVDARVHLPGGGGATARERARLPEDGARDGGTSGTRKGCGSGRAQLVEPLP